MTTRTLRSLPRLATPYARALGAALPVVGRALAHHSGGSPPTLRVEDVAVDAAHLRAYERVCGFASADRLPATYPQTVAFPLILSLLTEPTFPFGALGAVHIGNTIEYQRPLTSSDTLDYEVSAGEPADHLRGRKVVVSVDAMLAGDQVWHADMELLHRERVPADREKTAADPSDLPDDPPPGPQTWRLRGDLGRRYAAISGDRNPIHLADLTARPFGFSRHIAHGMWTHARALAELENRLPDAYDVRVAFMKPVTLPGTVQFGARRLPDRIDFGVSSRAWGSADSHAASQPVPHLLGRVRPR